MCVCYVSQVLTRLAELTTQWTNREKRPALLSSSRTFLAFLLEQEIHYPSVDYSDHNETILTMFTPVFVCAVDTRLAE